MSPTEPTFPEIEVTPEQNADLERRLAGGEEMPEAERLFLEEQRRAKVGPVP